MRIMSNAMPIKVSTINQALKKGQREKSEKKRLPRWFSETKQKF